MIQLDPGQMRLLDTRARENFRTLLAAQLREAYPALWTPLPAPLAERVIGDRIDHAQERYDITFQSALTTYLHYCSTFGAHFDRQSSIAAVLDDAALFPDDIPDLLPARVGDAAWALASQEATRADWLERLPLADRIAARFCWALPVGQRHAAADPALHQHISASIEAARQVRIEDDAGLAAFALCRTMLGIDFVQRAGKPWVRPIFTDPAILPALRGATLAGCAELEWEVVL